MWSTLLLLKLKLLMAATRATDISWELCTDLALWKSSVCNSSNPHTSWLGRYYMPCSSNNNKATSAWHCLCIGHCMSSLHAMPWCLLTATLSAGLIMSSFIRWDIRGFSGWWTFLVITQSRRDSAWIWTLVCLMLNPYSFCFIIVSQKHKTSYHTW